jgi:hypothetical protein
MRFAMTLRSPVLIVLTALFLAACALSGVVPRPPDAAFDCALVITDGQFEGRITVREPLSGDYAIALGGNGISIGQSGPFTARPGQIARLGGGTTDTSGLDATMTVTVAGQTRACPVTQP